MTPEEVKTETVVVQSEAGKIVVHDAESYQAAGAFLVRVKALRKKVADVFGPMKAAAVAAHKAVLAQEKAADEPLARAESTVKQAIGDYAAEQERVRRAEEDRLREIARKAEEERRIAEAVTLEQKGDVKAAEAVIAAPIQTPAVTLATQTPKVAGVSFTERWEFDIVDANAIPREYLLPDLVKIRRVVVAMKGETRIPGIVARAVKTVSGRAF